MSDLHKLAETIEAAEAGSRELDAEIAVSFYPEQYDEYWPAMVARGQAECPHYTTSIDSALSLLPEGWCLTMLGGAGLYHAQVKQICGGPNATEAGVSRASLSLALCLAIIRSIAGERA